MHELYRRPEVRDAVVERVGPRCSTPTARSTGPRWERLAFGDPRLLAFWSASRIRSSRSRASDSAGEAEAAGARVAVQEIPLLFERGGADRFDRTVLITAPDELRRARDPRAVARQAHQLPEDEKRALADEVFVNDGSVEALDAWVAQLVRRLRRMRRVGLVFDERYLWHDTGVMQPGPPLVEPYPHWESPETKRRFKNLLDASGLSRSLVALDPRPATDEEILRLHTPGYLAWLERGQLPRVVGTQAMARPFGRGSLEIARLAAGGCIVAADAVLDGRVDAAYALVRPPATTPSPSAAAASACSATSRSPRCTCAARPRRRAHRGRRLGRASRQRHRDGVPGAIPTCSRSRCTRTASTRSAAARSGAWGGPRARCDVNVPLPPARPAARTSRRSTGRAPCAGALRPELGFVASGLDASAFDPLGRMQLRSVDYRALTDVLVAAVRAHLRGPSGLLP